VIVKVIAARAVTAPKRTRIVFAEIAVVKIKARARPPVMPKKITITIAFESCSGVECFMMSSVRESHLPYRAQGSSSGLAFLEMSRSGFLANEVV
jgi:hypothetical protein